MVEYIPWFIVVEKVVECECPLHWATYILLMLCLSLCHGHRCLLTVDINVSSQNEWHCWYHITWNQKQFRKIDVHHIENSFIHSIGMWRFLAILRSFFHSSLLGRALNLNLLVTMDECKQHENKLSFTIKIYCQYLVFFTTCFGKLDHLQIAQKKTYMGS
jgi:hypothetical protein